MGWVKEAITDGELDALARAARMAWADDTCLPRYAERRVGFPDGSGQCYVSAMWLVRRLGGMVGKRGGHFVWLSPDKHWYIDLTGNHTGRVAYERNTDFPYQPFVHTPTSSVTRRSVRFTKRADQIFDNLDKLLKVGLDYAGDAYPAEEPQASEDSQQADSYWHDEPTYDGQYPQTYQFFYGNGQMEVSPNHSHDELASHLGIDAAAHTGPVAAGHIVVQNGKATYEVATNVNIKALERIFKDHAKHVGWQWGGITNAEGEPISDEFAPKTTSVLNWVYDRASNHLDLGRTTLAELHLARSSESSAADGLPEITGRVTITDRRAYVSPVVSFVVPSLIEWAEDAGLTLYAGNDNVYKTIPDLGQGNTTDVDSPPSDSNLFADQAEDSSGLFRCPSCDRLFGTWHDYQKHRRDEESWGDPVEDGKFPDIDMDKTLPPHFHEQPLQTMPVASVREARRVDGFERYASAFGYDTDEGYTHYVAFQNGSPVGYATVRNADLREPHLQMVYSAVKRQGVARALTYKVMQHYPVLITNTMHDWEEPVLRQAGWVNTNGQMWKWSLRDSPASQIEAPVPFVYDVQEDEVTVGKPGQRTSDIPGRFTPGGIVEGTYEPGGKVFIRSMTTIPYTVRHLVQLWYYQHPELEVKSVSLRDDSGKDTRLAHAEISPMVRTLALADPAVHAAHRILSEHGGNVYVVGGAVRDVVADRIPKDFDLMVTGLPGEHVKQMLRSLPGQATYKGKDFAVFRYKTAGSEVEIALPRREHSTGDGHRDFEVTADHKMDPKEDLYRRDFTVNAMAVNLSTGEFLDPFGGTADIASGSLRALGDHTFPEDPLRLLRAVVAHARHGLVPNAVTRVQMRDNSHRLSHLPAERIRWELDKLMESEDPVAGIKLAHETGLLKLILPEVDAAFGYNQKNPHHAHDLGTHLLQVLGRMCGLTDDIDLRYAALLHDIGKPSSAWWHPVDQRKKYYEHHVKEDLAGVDEVGTPYTITAGTIVGQNHHSVGALMAEKRLRELKFPEDRIKRIATIIEHHMWKPFEHKKGARKFLARVGEHADDLLTFRIADQGGKGVDALNYGRTPEGISKQASLIYAVRNEGEATDEQSLAIDGNDLIEEGIPAGPEIGRIKKLLLSKVIEDPEYNTREHLLAIARQEARKV